MGKKPRTDGPAPSTVTVLGGGLAGLSAARCLVESGYRVTLVEKRPFLGGRAFSFRDPEAGCEVDNGQHIFMGCCSYYIDFLKALGALDKTFLQSKLRAEVILDGTSGVLSSVPLMGALHLLPSLILYPHLGLRDKLLAVYALIKAKLTNRSKHAKELDQQTFYQWLKQSHQTERAINNLWNLIILPTLNDDIRNVNADMGLMILREGLLKGPHDAAIGFSKVGLTTLTGEPGQRFLEQRGGNVMLGKAVKRLEVESGSVSAVELSDGSALESDAYVCALPFDAVLQLLPAETADDPFFSSAAGLGSSPIVGIHIWYDKPVMEQDLVAFLNSPVQWVFNRSLIQGSNTHEGQYLCISLSGAWDFVDRSKQELRQIFAGEMERLFPTARNARIERFLVVKQPQATFRCVPGVAAHRPAQVTPIPNLFLAGEWTDTGWPSTMEGAVRSGVLAAKALASRF